MQMGILLRYVAAGAGLAALTWAGGLAVVAQGRGAPEVVPRTAWRAKPANVELMKRQTPREIVIHHTAVKQQPKVSMERKLRGLQGFSQSADGGNGQTKTAWGDIPYHFYIDAGGRIGEGRDVGYAGDTNTAYVTADRVQVVLEGHFDNEQPASAQLQALDRLVVWLAAKYRVPADRVSGHSDHAGTECPGQHLKSYLPALREKVAKAAARG